MKLTFLISLSLFLLHCNVKSSNSIKIHLPKHGGAAEDRRRIKFGPIRSPFVADIEEENQDEEEEDLNEDSQKKRTSILYFFISSFINALNNLKTLWKFLMASNQVILLCWILFIIGIFVLSYLFTTSPVIFLGEEDEEEEAKEKECNLEGKTPAPVLLAYYDSEGKPTTIENTTADMYRAGILEMFQSSEFLTRFDDAVLKSTLPQDSDMEVVTVENLQEIDIEHLSLDCNAPKNHMIIRVVVKDFSRRYILNTDRALIIKGLKFAVDSTSFLQDEHLLRFNFEIEDPNIRKLKVQCLTLNISNEIERNILRPLRQRSKLLRSTGDSLSVTVLKLSGGGYCPSKLRVGLELDEPAPQGFQTTLFPFHNDSECVWNSQFLFAINRYKSKRLSLEVVSIEPKSKEEESIGLASISTSSLYSVRSQKHAVVLTNPLSRNPTSHFLSVHLTFIPANLRHKDENTLFYVHKTSETNFDTTQYIRKTSYKLQRKKIPCEPEREEKSTSIIADAVLNDLMGIQSVGNLDPYRSTMVISSVQKIQLRKEPQTLDITGYESNKHESTAEFNVQNNKDGDQFYISDEEQDEKKAAESARLSIESLQSYKNPLCGSPPVKKFKKSFLSTIKQKISGPGIDTGNKNIAGSLSRLYSSPSKLRKRFQKSSSSSTSIKSLNRDTSISVISSDFHNRIDKDEDDSYYSTESESEFSFELSHWKGPRSLSWESWESDGSYLLLPVEGDTSSTSDISGISTASFATGSSGNVVKKGGRSLLVFETKELGFKRHYLIPYKKGGTRLSKKQGTKLHVFNNHTFIAKHIKGGTYCSVCKKRIIMRLGKQGYVCRDCGRICHKRCHEKTEEICEDSTFPNMELFRGSTIMKKSDSHKRKKEDAS